MTNNDLQIGDLIFYTNTLGSIEHIAMYINHKDTTPYVVHAVSSPYNSIMLTQIKPADPGCSYHVMRPVNNEITLIAAGILLRWVEHQVPFATEKKRNALINCLDDIGGFDTPNAGKVQEPHGKKTYRATYLQYLDMANALPYIPKEQNEIKGFSCSEAIVSAFNVALIIACAAIIPTLQGDTWSLDAFTSLDDYIDLLKNPLPFDAKSILAAGIFEHCTKNSEDWLNQGVLTIVPREETNFNEHKEVWREFKTALLAEAPEKLKNFIASPTQKNHSSSPRFFSAGERSRSSSCASTSQLLTCTEITGDEKRTESVSSPFNFLNLLSLQEAAGTGQSAFSPVKGNKPNFPSGQA